MASVAGTGAFAASDYYSVVAEVIPVLFILLVFQFRIVDYEEWSPTDSPGTLAIVASVFMALLLGAMLGEAAALHGLKVHRSSGSADFLILAALLSAAITMLAVPVLDARSRLLKARKGRGESDTRLALNVGRTALAVLSIGALLLPLASVVVGLIAVL